MTFRTVALALLLLLTAACAQRVHTVLVVNDTSKAWHVCGSDCRTNDAAVQPGAAVVVHTRDGDEIFLEQNGRQTDDCLFPSHNHEHQTIKVSSQRRCVR